MKHSEPGQTTPPHLLESVDTAEQCLPSSLTTLSTIDPSTSPPPHPLDTRGLARLRTLRGDRHAALATGHTDAPPPRSHGAACRAGPDECVVL